ncbi:MAG: hypothetical protein EXQ52_08745 [Bryobacterales bacterium]|nr:hypothetical protein [Bryobacterales bacterium]
MLSKIKGELAAYNNCANWLTGGSDLIGALLEENTFGHGVFNDNATAAIAGSRNADGTPTGVPVTASFTVNDNGAFFSNKFRVGAREYVGGGLGAQAAIPIHELAHIVGAKGFQSDFGKKDAGIANDKLVDKSCRKLIGNLR